VTIRLQTGQESEAKEFEAAATVHLTLDGLEAVNLTFRLAVAQMQIDRGGNSVEVAFQSLGKPSNFSRCRLAKGFIQPFGKGCRLTALEEFEESVGKIPCSGDFRKGIAHDLFQLSFGFCQFVSEEQPREILRRDPGPHRPGFGCISRAAFPLADPATNGMIRDG